MRTSSRPAVFFRFLIGASLLGVVALALSGCGGRPKSTPEPAVVYREVKVAVATGCVVKRPDPVQSMNSKMPMDQWRLLAPGAKASAVQAQAGERMNYEDALRASTSACGEAK